MANDVGQMDGAVILDSDMVRGPLDADPVQLVLSTIGASVERKPDAAYELKRVIIQRTVTPGAVVNIYGASGVPAVGLAVVQMRPDGRGEIAESDSAGHAQFNWGPGSAFSQPGAGPFTVGIVQDARKDDDSKFVTTGALLGDLVKSLGDYEGEHIQVYLQFVERGAAPPPAGKPDLRALIAALTSIHGAFDELIAALERL